MKMVRYLAHWGRLKVASARSRLYFPNHNSMNKRCRPRSNGGVFTSLLDPREVDGCGLLSALLHLHLRQRRVSWACESNWLNSHRTGLPIQRPFIFTIFAHIFLHPSSFSTLAVTTGNVYRKWGQHWWYVENENLSNVGFSYYSVLN